MNKAGNIFLKIKFYFMKTVMNIFRMKTLILTATFILAFTSAGKADTLGELGETPAVLKYIGNVNDQPVFQLTLSNTESDEFYITIKDATGYVVYTERVSGKDVTRKYRLNTDEVEVTGLTFEVKSKLNDNKVIYTIQKNGYYVEDMVVSKL